MAPRQSQSHGRVHEVQRRRDASQSLTLRFANRLPKRHQPRSLWANAKQPRDRVAATAVVAASDVDSDDADDADAVSVNDLIEMEIGGVSVSDEGFVALLVPKGCRDAVPRAPNPVEAMRGVDTSMDIPEDVAEQRVLPVLLTQSTDTEGAVSEWAQTMLQLLQTPPIDMGILLPYTALDDLTKMEGSVLGAVLIGEAAFKDAASDESATREYSFASTLLAGKEFEQQAFDVVGGPAEAWRALALALRYSPYGARIFVTEGALQGADVGHFFTEREELLGGIGKGLALGSIREVFPRLQSVIEARAIAAEARNLLVDPFISADDEDTPGEVEGST